MIRFSFVLCLVLGLALGQRELIRPDPTACAGRINHSSGFRGNHYYFYSWSHAPTSSHERDWLDARNICRKHCQDLVSLETREEAEFVNNAITTGNVKYIWTSGRKCNFDGCDRADLQPIEENGWFWSGSDVRLPNTNPGKARGYNGLWSRSGGGGRPQPDNREFSENGNDEACLGILNNFYNDGIVWHDIACYHLKPWVCEDSDSLLRFARFSNPNVNIP